MRKGTADLLPSRTAKYKGVLPVSFLSSMYEVKLLFPTPSVIAALFAPFPLLFTGPRLLASPKALLAPDELLVTFPSIFECASPFPSPEELLVTFPSIFERASPFPSAEEQLVTFPSLFECAFLLAVRQRKLGQTQQRLNGETLSPPSEASYDRTFLAHSPSKSSIILMLSHFAAWCRGVSPSCDW